MNSLLDPAILFFIFGVLAGTVKSNLEIPPAISRFLSLYLLMALGLKGGFALAQSGLTLEVGTGLGAAICLALVIPAQRVRALLGGGVGAKGKFQRQMMESLARRLVRLLERLPVYQGAFGEPKTEAAVRKALEKMYGDWAV